MDMSSILAKQMLKYILLPLLIAAGAAFYKYCPWLGQDNPVEEKIELFIKAQTGKDVDLSPDSKEK